MISTSWRRVLLSTLAVALLLVPALSQAAPRAPHAPHASNTDSAVAVRDAEPMQWLSRVWRALAGAWETAAAAVTGSPDGGAAGSTTSGDSGASADPDGHHG